MSAVLAWVAAHPYEALIAAGALLSILNGALPASVQRGPIGRVLHDVLDRLAVLSRADARGTLKWPGVASALLAVPAPAAPAAPPSVGPLAPSADPVAPPVPTPAAPAPVASDDGNAAAYELARREVAAARVFDPLSRETIAPPEPPAQGGHVEGGAMLGVCVLMLAASLLFVGCPDWQRPACPAPGAYSCVNGWPHYCARTTHELTPIGDENCAVQGRACAFNDAGQTFCARLDAAVSE